VTSGGSADVAYVLGTQQIIFLDLLFFGAYRMELRKEDSPNAELSAWLQGKL